MSFLIDPINITNFNCSNSQLELQILFWICAAGKNGVTSARCLNGFLETLNEAFWFEHHHYDSSPLNLVQFLETHTSCKLERELKKHGIGCYKQKAKKFRRLAVERPNLRKIEVDELQAYVGPKTARCFLIHTRPNQRLAGLDTHILKYLRDQGFKVPKSTPSGRRYLEIEQVFLDLVDKSGKSVAEFDLDIWNKYRSLRKYKHEKPLAKTVRAKKKKVLEN
jgi:hypothetical protein